MFRRCWEYISSVGIRDEYDDILVKRITLTNRFSVIAIVVFLFSGINNIVLGDLFSGLLIEGLVVVCLLGFYLNKLGYHRFAVSFLFTIVSIAIFYFDSYSGVLSGTYLYHFPLILAIAFIFDMREDIPNGQRSRGLVVITGDKGLAGAYNHNILKLAGEWMEESGNNSYRQSGICSVSNFRVKYFFEKECPSG